MTDTQAPSAQDPATRAGPLQACDVRLPVLRRPPGWSVLGETALRVRATQLYLASLPQVEPQAGQGPIGLMGSSVPTGLIGSIGSIGSTQPWGPGGASGAAAPGGTASPHLNAMFDAVTTTHVDGASAALSPAPAPADPATPPPVRRGSHWHLLPWALLLGGAMLMTPWLIWAPLVGGLCMGLLLLQTGMLRHWLQARSPEGDVSAGASGRRESGFAQTGDFADEAGLQAVQAVGPRRLRFAHGGWMLTAALALVGVQAAMLITTLQLKSREPAALAGAIRAAQTGRDGRQGTPPGPQEEQPPVRDGTAAMHLAPRPEARPAGAAGPRQGGTP